MQDRKLGLVGGIVRAAQLHPWRTVEHCTIVLLALHLLSGRACVNRNGAMLCPAVLNAAGVTPAPQPTMTMDMQPGKTVEHHDFRGDIYRFPLGDGIILNLMRTAAGTMRSGDLHNCTQYDIILAGRAKLVTYDTATRRETAVVYDRNDLIKIPARVPHLFEFLEENYMIEWWDCEFRSWYYQPYRDRISRAFEAAKAKDAGSRAGAAAADTAGKQANMGRAAGDGAASQPADQQGASSSIKQSRAEAARRQQGGGKMAQQQQQQQQQQAAQAGAEGATGHSAGAGTAQQVAGGHQGAEEAAGARAAAGGSQRDRTGDNVQESSAVDPRLGDPVAAASQPRGAVSNDGGTAGDAQVVGSAAADRTKLLEDAKSEPKRKQPRQQQGVRDTGQQLSDESQAAADETQVTKQTTRHEDLEADIDGEELTAEHEDYRGAELQ